MLAFVTLDMQFPLLEANAGACMISHSTGRVHVVRLESSIKLFFFLKPCLEPLAVTIDILVTSVTPIAGHLGIDMLLVWCVSLIFKADSLPTLL